MSEFSGGMDSSGLMDGSMGEGMGNAGSSLGGSTGTTMLNPGVKGVKFSDMLQGINVTPNFMLAMLFLGFTAWLFVIYWIRHNEPLANQVLGTPQACAPTAHEDRKIVNGLKHALPIRTSHRTGNFFTPDKKIRQEQAKYSTQQEFHQNLVMPHSQPHGNLTLHYSQPGASHARVLKSGREHVVVPHPEPMQMAPAIQHQQLNQMHTNSSIYHRGSNAHIQARQANIYGNPRSSHYHIPVQTVDGRRLKTVVNR